MRSAPADSAVFSVRTLSLSVALAFSATAQAQSLPSGGQVSVGGGVVSNPSANMLLVTQSTDRLAINWQSFNIGAGHGVRFEQPSASSIALNRVLGGSRSEIYGNLSANGQVFLINPNGVLFGRGAEINVGGLVASTLNLTDRNFLDGKFVFEDPSNTASVVNEGKLVAANGGYLALIANKVINNGSMQAHLGSVVLGAGGTAHLTLADSKLVKFEVTQGALDALAANGGLIRANGGQVILTAGARESLLASTVNNTGVIEAQTVDRQPGNILLLAGMQSGTTNVGGTLDASAPNGGDGGFIETSAAHVKVADSARVTTLASTGQAGMWLIDPKDFTIAASGGDVSGATVMSGLAAGNVSIVSSLGTAGGASGSGDINVNDAVAWSANTLTLTAARDININAVMTASGTSKLTMNTSTANGLDIAVAGGLVRTGFNLDGTFKGRVDFGARTGTGFLTINGNGYTVVNSMGARGSTTTTDLQGINGNLAGFYALGANVDAGGFTFWPSIGANFLSFTGKFDGLGHTISNFKNSVFVGGGMFARVTGGSLGNIGLINPQVSAQTTAGALVAQFDSGTINNSYVNGGIVNSQNASGGLVGSSGGSISNSYAATTVGGGSNNGGLVAVNGSGASITNSYSTSSVSGDSYLGGLAGGNFGAITSSYASGPVTGTGTGIGGLVGNQISTASITNSYATGLVRGGSAVGGLVGQNPGTVAKSYATGIVSGGSEVGGLVGQNTGTVTNSYWNTETSGVSASAGGVGRTTAQLQGSLPAGLDAAVWSTGPGMYPYFTATTPGGLQAISGFVYDGSVVGGGLVGGTVFGFANGQPTTSSLIGANGYYYLTTSAAMLVPSGSYVLANTGGQGATLTIAAGTVSGLDIRRGLLTATTDAQTYSTVPARIAAGLAAATGGNSAVIAQVSAMPNGNHIASTAARFDIDQAVNLTGNATIKTVSPGADLNVNSPITTNGGTLAISATGDVNVNNAMNLNGSGLSLSAGRDITLTSTANWTASALNLGAGRDINLNGATNWNASLPTLNASRDINVNGAVTWTGNTLSYASSGNVNLNSALDWSAGTLSLFAVKDINVNAVLTASGTAALTLGNSTGGVKMGFNPDGTFKGRVDFGARSGTGFLTVNGAGATVINNLADLQGMSGNLAGNYALGANIDATATSGWNGGAGFAPIGGDPNTFTGRFDGLGHTITNLTINRPTQGFVGLFGYAFRGDVGIGLGNVGLEGGSITGGSFFTGALAGVARGVVSNSYSKATVVGANSVGGLLGQSDGTVNNSYATGTVTGNFYVGGLAGQANFDDGVNNSYASGNVTGSNSVGGLVGRSQARISNSHATGAVSGDTDTGGLVGRLTRNSPGIDAISSSYSTGRVSGNANTGGLVGNKVEGQIGSSYATGNVSGFDYVGGLVGVLAGTDPVHDSYATGSVIGNAGVGGLVGRNLSTIRTSYATGLVTSTTSAGGLAGVGGGTVTSSYWDAQTTGQTGALAGATALTSAQMLQSTNFAGFDFTSSTPVWKIYSGHTAPLLASFLTPLTITADNVTKAYDATSVRLTNLVYSAPSASGSAYLLGLSTPYGAVAKNNVGVYAADLWSDQRGYNITLIGGGLTVTPASLNYVANAANRNYGAANPTLSGSVSGFANGESLATATTGAAVFNSTATASSNAGGYAITGSGLTVTDGNYVFAQAAGNGTALTVNPATLTFTANAANRTYGAANPVLAGSVSGFVNGESLATATIGATTFNTGAIATSNVGSYAISGGGLTANNGNYVFAQGAGNATALTINPATLTYGANAANRTYGAANPALTGSVGGFVNGEALATATIGATTFNTGAIATSNVGSYAIAGGGLTANNGNYVFAQGAGNATALTINPATLTYAANTANRTYGAANPALDGSVSGFFNGESLATATIGTAAFTTSAIATSNVGSYAITGAGLAANNGNYVFAQSAGNSAALTINPATLTYTANAANRTYGAANPVLAGSVSGFVNGESLATASTGAAAFSTGAIATSNVGGYAITGGGLTANNGNYAFAQGAGNAAALTINPATLTYTANAADRAYGAVNPALSGSVSGFVNGESLTTATSGAAGFNTSAIATSSVGSYTIAGAGLGANNGNYVFAQNAGNGNALTVKPAPLVVSAAAFSKLYDGTAYSGGNGVTYSGLVNGESVSILGGALAYGGSSQGAMIPGSYAITPGGFTAANYSLSYADGALKITTIADVAGAQGAINSAQSGGSGQQGSGGSTGNGGGTLKAGFVQGSQGGGNAGGKGFIGFQGAGMNLPDGVE